MLPSAVRGKPLIQPGSGVESKVGSSPTSVNTEPSTTGEGECGNGLLHGFWVQSTDTVSWMYASWTLIQNRTEHGHHKQ
jgi:hypothetical protein